MRFSLRKTAQLSFLLFTCYVLYFIITLGRHKSASETNIDEVDQSEEENGKILIGKFWTPEKQKEYRNGPGENGEPVKTLPAEESKKDEAYSDYGFNQYISDKISLERSITDTRSPK